MPSHPSTEETNAMAAFLASRSAGVSLEERAKQWQAVVELIKSNSGNLVSGSNEVNTKNKGAVE